MHHSYFFIVIVFISLLLYLNACFCGFVFDDVSAVQNNNDVTGKSSIMDLLWNDYWGTPMLLESSHKSYRPFTVFTYRMNHLLFGNDAWSYHVVNILLNCIVCCLVFQLYATITKLCFNQSTKENHLKKFQSTNAQKFNVSFNDEFYISAVASILFAVHPVHTEAVTGIVGRAELLSSLFFILSILFYVKLDAKSLVLTFLFSTLAVASKEQGITVVAVCVFIDIIIINKLSLDDFCLVLVKFVYSPKLCKHKSLLFRILLSFCFVLFNLVWRYHVMQGQLPHFTSYDNPAAAANAPSRQLTLNYLLPLNAWLLLLPNGLLCDWTMGTIPIISGFDDARNLASVAFWIVYIAIGIHVFFHNPVSKITSLSLAIATFSFLPASNLFFTVGFVIAERVLFLPSIGFCLLIAVGLWIIKKKFNCERLTFVFMIALLFSNAAKTVHRNFDWKSELSLFQSGLKVTKQNAKIWNNIGHAYEANNEWKKALHYFIEATKVQPDDFGAHQNVARTYKSLGNFSAAEATYRKAKALLPQPIPGKPYIARVPPSSLKIFVGLAELVKSDRPEEANQLYLEVIQMRPLFLDAYINRGEILLTLNRPSEALKCYEKALLLPNANKSDIFYNIGVVHSHMGNHTGAVQAYTYSIAFNPYNVKALFNSAVIFEETHESSLLVRAKSRIERVLALEPKNVMAMSLLGSVLMDLKKYDEAINWWTKALTYMSIDLPDGREDDCLNAVQRLLRHYPYHEKGLQLYADTLLNKKKEPKKAKKIYQQLLQINPAHIEANHNLCVVMVEEKDLNGAEACLMAVYNMAPHLDYIQDNLARVRRQLNLIKISEKEKKESEVTNFKKTPVTSAEEIEDRKSEQATEVQSEEVIYVAQPVKKHITTAEEAAKIREDLKNPKSRDIEENLQKAFKAVKKLEALRKKVEQKKKEKCPKESAAETNRLKQSALEILEKLESELEETET